jgi:hypothetical protein
MLGCLDYNFFVPARTLRVNASHEGRYEVHGVLISAGSWRD